MTHPITTLARATTRAVMAGLVLALAFPPLAVAVPGEAGTAMPKRGSGAQTVATGSAGSSDITLEASSTSIPTDGDFGFTVRLDPSKPVDYVRARVRLLQPNGRVIYQRTQIGSGDSAATSAYSFARTIGDIGLSPGLYPVHALVSVTSGGATEETELTTELLVYDPKRPPLNVALMARIAGQPMAGPDGRFVIDPASSTEARDGAIKLSEWALEDRSARITVAIAPVLLLEWARIAEGFDLATPGGVITYDADSTTSRSYATALNMLRQAAKTGRLEVLTLGYADPDLNTLVANGLAADVVAQYEAGISSLHTSLEATPSPGTMSAGGTLSEKVAASLREEGVTYAVVRPRSVAPSGGVAPGSYRAKDSKLRLLVRDDAVLSALSSTSTASAARAMYLRSLATTSSVIPIAGRIGPGHSDASRLIAFGNEIEGQPWARLVLGKDAAKTKSPRRVRLVGGKGITGAPAGYWAEVREARNWSRALASALPAGDPLPVAADEDSLIAESAAWAAGEWALADRGRAFAAHATRSATAVLGKVTITLKQVTLAGAKGEVPVTISNGTQRDLKVRLTVVPDQGVRLPDGPTQLLALQPQENFVQIRVVLQNVLSSKLRVTASAGGVVLDEQTVTVRASYLDRLAILGGVVLLLGGLLAYIIRRVRAVESADEGDDVRAQYTDEYEEDEDRRL